MLCLYVSALDIAFEAIRTDYSVIFIPLLFPLRASQSGWTSSTTPEEALQQKASYFSSNLFTSAHTTSTGK